VYHAYETTDRDTYEQTWEALGVTGSVVPLAFVPYPWTDDAHLGLVGGIAGDAETWCAARDAAVDDRCLDVLENYDPYAHLVCLVDEDGCP
jgi:hypothetical protein